MSKPPVAAVTFDLWDTLFADDSDEPKRAVMGLPPKREERRRLVHRFLDRREPIARELVDVAFDTAEAAFNVVWSVHRATWTVHRRLEIVLAGLRRQLPEEDLVELIRLQEGMELEFRPDPVVGVREALASLKPTYRLGVISDAVFTPGRALRRLLEGAGIEDLFDALIFSDEVGCSKPSVESFRIAAEALGVAPEAIAHVGDREEQDIVGAHEAGCRAVLCTVVKDRGSASTEADAILRDFHDLRSVIDSLR